MKTFSFSMAFAILMFSIGCTKQDALISETEQRFIPMEDYFTCINKMYPGYTQYTIEDEQGTIRSLIADETIYYLSDEGGQSVITPNDSLKRVVIAQLKKHDIPFHRHQCYDENGIPEWHIWWDNAIYIPVIE